MNNLSVKYRQLSQSELKEFEKEFIEFLVINGITADEWEKLKSENMDKVEVIIDKFSDVIFESTLRKVSYVQHISSKSIKCFQCLKNEIRLVGVDAPKSSNIDFNNRIPTTFNDIKVYTSTKKYGKQRELEIFNLINASAQISDGKLFKKLCLLL